MTKPVKLAIFKKGKILFVFRNIDGKHEAILPQGEIGTGKHASLFDIALKQAGMDIRPFPAEQQRWIDDGITVASWVRNDYSILSPGNAVIFSHFLSPKAAVSAILKGDPTGGRYHDELIMLSYFTENPQLLEHGK